MILVVGGAGYIGSHTNKELAKKGYDTIVLDNLRYGHREAVKWGEFIYADLNDIKVLRDTFIKFDIDAVIHFAAFAYVGESMTEPQKYYQNNVSNTINLLSVMLEFGCKKIIFSSTCATYGNPLKVPITEIHPQNPINPYGRSKLMVEQILFDYARAYDLKYVVLRYFNAAGADVDVEIGELHIPETHLIPLVLDVAIGKKESINIFGTDYNTKDGTCVRDYIHVTDLAQAHILALEYLLDGGESDVFNLGNGYGYSVMDIIETAKKVTGREIKIVKCARRDGDPAALVGSAEKIVKKLGWKPELCDIGIIIETAWKWHQKGFK